MKIHHNEKVENLDGFFTELQLAIIFSRTEHGVILRRLPGFHSQQ